MGHDEYSVRDNGRKDLIQVYFRGLKCPVRATEILLVEIGCFINDSSILIFDHRLSFYF